MARDPYDQVKRALARQRAEGDSSLEKYGRLSAASLSLDDLARVVANVIKAERADLIGHMNRLFKLSISKAAAGDDDEGRRAKNLHRRLCDCESAIRALQKGRSQ